MVKPLELITKDRPYILNQLDDLEQEMIRLRMIEELATNLIKSPDEGDYTFAWQELSKVIKGEN